MFILIFPLFFFYSWQKRDLGLPVALNPNEIKHKSALQYGKEPAKAAEGEDDGGELAELKNAGGTLVKSIVPKPADGLVREINEKRVVSHEETKDYFETEDVKHMGDFSDEVSCGLTTITLLTEATAANKTYIFISFSFFARSVAKQNMINK